LQVLQKALVQSGREIRSWAQNVAWRGFQVVLLDGSTVRLRPCGDIPKKLGVHRSRSKHSYWCLMRVVVGFCFCTGVLVGTATGTMSLSEQALAAQFLASLPPHCLIVGDRNFGVFSVLQAARAARVQVLVRLTKTRAQRLARLHHAKLQNGLDLWVDWAPTRQDKTDPNIPRQAVAGRLIALRVQRRGFRSQILYLFTTLRDQKTYAALDLLDLYGARWQAELNLRSVKTQLQLHALECKSAAMAEKEWIAGLLAYNLIRSLMVAAAAHSKLSVHILSFSRTLDFLRGWITRQSPCASAATTAWERLLARVAQCQHPRRKIPRPPEPRAKRYFHEIFPPLKGDRAVARQKLKTTHPKS
jgi:putative transposase